MCDKIPPFPAPAANPPRLADIMAEQEKETADRAHFDGLIDNLATEVNAMALTELAAIAERAAACRRNFEENNVGYFDVPMHTGAAGDLAVIQVPIAFIPVPVGQDAGASAGAAAPAVASSEGISGAVLEKLPKSARHVWDTPDLFARTCDNCREGKNIVYGRDGGIRETFCGSCIHNLAHDPLLLCTKKGCTHTRALDRNAKPMGKVCKPCWETRRA